MLSSGTSLAPSASSAAVVRLHADQSSFELARHAVAADLQPSVHEIVGYCEWSRQVSVRDELPRPRVSVVWELAPPIEHLHGEGSDRYPTGFAAGLHERPSLSSATSTSTGAISTRTPMAMGTKPSASAKTW